MHEKGNLKRGKKREERKRPEKKSQNKLRYDCNLCVLFGVQIYTVCSKLMLVHRILKHD